MSKPFNIHDWQAKQRLAEQDDYQRRQDALTPGKNPDAFYGPGSFYQKMKQKGVTNIPSDEEVESMSNVDIGVLDKMVKKYSMDKIMKTINILKDRPLPEGKNSTLSLSKSDMEKLHKDGKIEIDGHKILFKVEEDLNEALNPEISQKVNNFIKAMAKRYDYSEQDAVFAIMAALKQRSMDEMSTTGTGASFQAGAGEGYATPYAFKKKRKDN